MKNYVAIVNQLLPPWKECFYPCEQTRPHNTSKNYESQKKAGKKQCSPGKKY